MNAVLASFECKDWTASPPTVPAFTVAYDPLRAEFCRLPKPGQRCPITGLSRTTLNELIAAGKIRAAKIRRKGATRSITLIVTQSLRDYINGLALNGGSE